MPSALARDVSRDTNSPAPTRKTALDRCKRHGARGFEQPPGSGDQRVSSAEMVSPPARLMSLLRTSLLIVWLTGRMLPSQFTKLT